ncbi:MAG TPA: DMT family transporter [Usitatibacter sp.]|nr:DMT family transporter [Usitatibacter sp.]
MKRAATGPIAAMVAMVVIWGYSWVVMKIALRHAHPFDFAALRMGLACAMLFAIVIARGRPLRLSSYRMAIVVGLLQVGLFAALSQLALMYAGPGKTSVLTFTMPFWMVVFAHFILRERMRGPQWLAVALALAGLVLIVEPWRLTNVAGSLLAVAAGAVWAISAVVSKRWPTAGADPLIFTAWQLFFGFVALALLARLHPHAGIEWNAEFVMALLFSAVLATAVGWWLWTYVLAHTPAGIAGLNSLGIPVIAVLASALQLGERPAPLELAGMLLIGVALALLAALGIGVRGGLSTSESGNSPR